MPYLSRRRRNETLHNLPQGRPETRASEAARVPASHAVKQASMNRAGKRRVLVTPYESLTDETNPAKRGLV
jgi:hypothetical protein